MATKEETIISNPGNQPHEYDAYQAEYAATSQKLVIAKYLDG